MKAFIPDPLPVPIYLRRLLPVVAVSVACAASACQPGPEEGADEGVQEEDVAAVAQVSAAAPSPRVRPQPLDELPREDTRGLDTVMIRAAAENAAQLPRLYSMIVARDGEILLERSFRGPGLDQVTNVKSASKSLISAVAGLAIQDGLLTGLDQPVAPFFEQYLAEDADPRKQEITLRHLLSMRSGLESTSNRNYGRWVTSSNWARHAITRPLVAEPGSRMIYSTGNSHLLSAVISEAAGRSTHAYARERLAEPLGIRLPPWPTDPQGIHFGGNDMLISARDLFRFGELYRNGGTIDGERILSRQWIEDSWRVQLRRSQRRGDDYYGLGWWGRDSNGYAVRFAWGYGGQFLFIVPALELTVVFTSDPWSPREGPHNRRLHSLLDDLIVPAAMAGASSGRSGGEALVETAPGGRDTDPDSGPETIPAEER